MTHQTEAQRLAALLRSRNNNQAGFGLGPVCDEAAVELLRLNSVHADLERVSMQLVACGVVAMADTPDSAKKARAMHPDYESVSCDDVKRRVDECIELRARVAELEDMLANLPLSSLQRLRARIQRLEEMLAAVGAGGVGPLIPSKLTARDIADSALLGNIESPFNACMHQEHCKRWKKEAEAEQQFSARDDAERLKSVARGMSYNDHGEAVWKHTLMEIAVRLEAGGYAAPQPPTTEQSSVVERPQGERHPGVLMPSRSLVDRVILEIARYCNTGEMDDAESLLASLQLSLDPDQQPPTTEDCSVVEPPKGEQEPVVWQYRMRPDWGSQKDCWGPWQDCTMEQAAMYQRVPLLHDWAYESRQLYTHPQNLNCKSNQARLATLWGYTKEQPKREPQFDAISVEQERLAVQFCAEIAGSRGGKASPPGPVRLLEMAEALYRAEVGCGAPQPQGGREPGGQEPGGWPANAREVRAFLRGHVTVERYARADHQPDDNDTYTLSAHDLLGAFDWWTDFYQRPRDPLPDDARSLIGSMVAELRGHRYCGDCYPENGWPRVNRVLADYAAFKRAHKIGGAA